MNWVLIERPAIASAVPLFELTEYSLCMGGKEVALTKTEHAVVELLARNFGRVVRKNTLFDHLYQLDPDGGPLTLKPSIWVFKIRRKFAAAGVPLEIIARWGIGYELRMAGA